MKRCLHILIGALFLALTITACQPDTPPSAAVRVHLLSEPRTLHPLNSNVATRDYIMRYTHERLNTLDLETGELIPQLAELPVESADHLSYTFTIKPEAAWPDGTPLTAQDVRFTVKVMACPGIKTALKAYLEYLKDLRLDPDNPRRFTVEMASYYLNNPNFGIYTYILDPRIYDPENRLADYSLAELMKGGAALAEDTVLQGFATAFNDNRFGTQVEGLKGGSGPYEFAQWEKEQSITLVRNPSYWGKGETGYLFAQEPDTIQFFFEREDQLVETRFKAQELDASSYLSADVYRSMEESPTIAEHFALHEGQLGSYVCITVNTQPSATGRPGILSERVVRQALDMAIDKETIGTEALQGFARAANSPVRPDNALFHSELQARPYDPKAAAALLSEAGWEDTDGDGVREKRLAGTLVPLQISFFFSPGSAGVEQMAERLKANWALIGVDLELKPAPMGKYIQDILSGQYDLALLSLGASPLPYDFKQLFHSDQWLKNGRNNFSGFTNAQADSLIDALRTTPDLAQRREMAWQVQEILQEEVPMISLYFTTRRHILSKRLGDQQPMNESPFFSFNTLKARP